MLRRVVWKKLTGVSEVLTAPIIPEKSVSFYETDNLNSHQV
jgi:hypothetical protein